MLILKQNKCIKVYLILLKKVSIIIDSIIRISIYFIIITEKLNFKQSPKPHAKLQAGQRLHSSSSNIHSLSSSSSSPSPSSSSSFSYETPLSPVSSSPFLNLKSTRPSSGSFSSSSSSAPSSPSSEDTNSNGIQND